MPGNTTANHHPSQNFVVESSDAAIFGNSVENSKWKVERWQFSSVKGKQWISEFNILEHPLIRWHDSFHLYVPSAYLPRCLVCRRCFINYCWSGLILWNSGIYVACFPVILAPIYPCYYLFFTLVCRLACFLYFLSQTSVIKEKRKR